MTISDQEKSMSRVLRGIDALRNGGMVIMVDDEDRENEGDIVFAAQHVSPEKINFMSRHARGLICLALDPHFIDRLRLPMMVDAGKRQDGRGTAFTVSIEARSGVTTGISAHDRAHTVKVAIDDQASPDDLVVPGHIFPLRARSGGVLERAGHTEGSVDLAKLAGLKGAAVICEIMNEDGSMARGPDLQAMAKTFELPILSIPDLISYRLLQESLVEIEKRQPVETSHGIFDGVLFRSKVDGAHHFALVKGEHFANNTVDVRVHVQRPLVDVFGHPQQGGRVRIEYGMKMLQEKSHAVLVYLNLPTLQANFLDEMAELCRDGKSERDAEPRLAPKFMDQRTVGTGAQILRALHITKMRVHSTSQTPYKGLTGFGLEIVDTTVIKGGE